MNLDTIMNVEALKDKIRTAGGIVHGDGNVFFTNAEQFVEAARALNPGGSQRSLIAGREVVSGSGAAITVTRLLLTPEGKARLQSKSPGIFSRTEAGVQCECGDSYPANSWGAGFIDAKGHCANCDAAHQPTAGSGGVDADQAANALSGSDKITARIDALAWALDQAMGFGIFKRYRAAVEHALSEGGKS